ncbi:MAG: YncE family protein [Terriglobales bacterium]
MRRSHVLVLSLPLLCISLWGSQLRQVAIIDLPGRPGFDQLAFANGMLVIAHQDADTLDVFSPAKRRIVARVQGMSDPHGLAVDARTGKIYVANTGANNIAVVSTKDWKLERTIALAVEPFALTLGPDGKRLFIANWRGQSISAVEVGSDSTNSAAESGAVTVNLGGSPQQMVYDPARNVLFVAVQDRNEIVVLDPDLRVSQRYKLAASQPTGMALDSGARRLYVAVRSAVLALNADDGRELGRVAAPPGADSLWLDGASGTLYVGSGGGYINLIRTAGGSFVAQDEIRTNVRGHSLAFDPGRSLIYMPGGREGKSKLLILRHVPESPENSASAPQLATNTH